MILLTVTKDHESVYVNIEQIATVQPGPEKGPFDPGAVLTFGNGNWMEVEENVDRVLKGIFDAQEDHEKFKFRPTVKVELQEAKWAAFELQMEEFKAQLEALSAPPKTPESPS